VTAMDIAVHGTSLPHNDPDASLVYRDTLGFQVRNDVGYGGMHWITVGPADQPDTSISALPVRLLGPTIPPGRCDPRLQE